MENQNLRMLYATRTGTVITYEPVPIAFNNLVSPPMKRTEYDDKPVPSNLKIEKHYMQETQKSTQGPVLYKINPTGEIKRESPLIERIILEGKREIELRVTEEITEGRIIGRQLEARSRNKNGTVTYTISKKLAHNITPERAIANAEKSVLIGLEMNKRKTEMRKGLAPYLPDYYSNNYNSDSDSDSGGAELLFDRFRIDRETMKEIMHDFRAKEKEKIPA